MDKILDEDMIYKLWWDGMTVLQIAVEFEVTTKVIENIIDKFQINLFNQEES
ncbi:MAG: hypothetical protein GWN01_15720 [Nitrosopumilaceae archaeon]|nr:hypothetical protein [Nitrosopumilaceae archaeon]NIU88742.1 hypothetical protein [Nitrosopumilaceae archaeon]NIV66877.1 hypothetical protein [Nitrosopumilaceae archaeon]NIX62891.1 hypothetical protein [Nitrosopumilaceae archaeon]